MSTCATSTKPTCGCSLTDEDNGVDCLNCVLYSNGITPPAASIQSIQAYLDEYVEACNLAGVSLPATTLSGAVSGITSTLAGNTFTSVNRPTLTSATDAGNIPTQASGAAANQQIVTADSSQTQSASSGGQSGLGGNKNSGSSTRGRETAGAAAAVAAVLVVFF
ncbi:hypothetical protein C0995_008278 [Termitomyces sp. Mi166|nr:hypothetical protein C0995_008278 [Termitomyces sp. Mi166\